MGSPVLPGLEPDAPHSGALQQELVLQISFHFEEERERMGVDTLAVESSRRFLSTSQLRSPSSGAATAAHSVLQSKFRRKCYIPNKTARAEA